MFVASRRFFSLKLRFDFGSASIANPFKTPPTNEDSFVTHDGLLGVFDGVSAWRLRGIDSSKFTSSLALNLKRRFIVDSELYHKAPKRLLNDAVTSTVAKGTSTACYCFLDSHSSNIHVVNLGDSKLIHLRSVSDELESLYSTTEQHHPETVIPFQIGYSSKDTYTDADYAKIQVEKGDLLILGTDGLWNNISPSKVTDIIQPLLAARRVKMKTVAEILAAAAFDVANPTQAFSESGKPDDITVIAARIVKNK